MSRCQETKMMHVQYIFLPLRFSLMSEVQYTNCKCLNSQLVIRFKYSGIVMYTCTYYFADLIPQQNVCQLWWPCHTFTTTQYSLCYHYVG